MQRVAPLGAERRTADPGPPRAQTAKALPFAIAILQPKCCFLRNRTPLACSPDKISSNLIALAAPDRLVFLISAKSISASYVVVYLTSGDNEGIYTDVMAFKRR